MQIPGISVIGLGALGTTLSQAFLKCDMPIKSVFNRTESQAVDFATNTAISIASTFPVDTGQLGDVVFLTVPDAVILSVAQKLAGLPGSLSGKTFVHCSGNESAAILSVLQDKGGEIASMHPLQTFNITSLPDDFQGIYFSLQGDPKALPLLEYIARQLGAKPLNVTESQKAHLHAAAVMASNYLVSLFDASAEIGALAGLEREEVQKMLHPLIQTTVENLEGSSFEDTISGPIARGDSETVKKHLGLLKKSPKLRTYYTQLGLKTLEKVEEADKISKESVRELRHLLQS